MESIALALPVLLLFIWLEYYVSKKKQKNYYKFNDSITNFSIAILDRITGMLFVSFFFLIYDFTQKKFGIFEITGTWYNWLILFFLVDFLWYWYHRSSHEINVFWAVHVVHHSSDEFNLVVGTRITLLQSLVRLIFWILLPLLGFPAPMIMLILLIQGVYPFFVHTRFIGKLGILESFLVTPSHHRVHHGSNESYIDKNYGGVLIIWDRLFGTFAEETEEVKYGITKPLTTTSLLWHIFHFILELYYSVKITKGFINKIKILFGGPELIDPTLRPKLEQRFLSKKYNFPISKAFKRYVIWQIGVSVVALLALLYFFNDIPNPYLLVFSLVVVLTLVNCGAILEQKRWIFHLEYARGISLLALSMYTWQDTIVWGSLTMIFILSILGFEDMRKYYFRQLVA